MVWFGRRNSVGNIQNKISGKVHFCAAAGVWACNFTENFQDSLNSYFLEQF